MVSKMKRFQVIKKWILLIVLFSVVSNSYAQISTTRQNLDGFSFKKGFKVNGGLSFQNEFYQGSDSLVIRDPYAFYLNGNLNLNLWGIDMPFSFSLSNTQRSFTQPFNRFRIDPSYKWVHLLVGSHSLTYSPYTMAGHQINGVGVELTPKNWDISAFYGRLNKAIEYDPLENNFSSIAYKRMGYAAKVGYKSKTGNYMLTFFHADDDENSLSQPIPVEYYITPKRNTAVSVSINQSFLKYFYVSGEYAISAYNTNIMNENGIPVSSSSLLDFLRKDNTDQSVDAYNASLGYQGKVFGIALRYEHVDPYYTSLGGYYFNDDMDNYTVAPNLRLLKGRLNFSGNFGLQYDNLDQSKNSDNKRLVYSANLSYNSGKVWSGGINFSNFKNHTRMRPTAYPFLTDDLDSLNFYQISQSLSVFSNFIFGDKKSPNNISLSVSCQKADMLTEDNITSYNDFYNAYLSYLKDYDALKLSWSTTFNFNYSDVTGSKTYYYGPGASINKSFLKDRLTTSLNVTCNMNQVEDREMGGLLNSQLCAAYSIKAKNEKLGTHTFSVSSGYTYYMGAMATSSSQYELLTRLSYTTNF